MRNAPLVAAAALLVTPVLAAADTSPNSAWSVTAQVWGGRSRYDVAGLKSNVSTLGTTDGKDLMSGRFTSTGAQAIVRLGWLDVGALWEGSLPRSGVGSAIVTPLVGIAWNLSDRWRIDLLGEAGGHQVSGIGQSGSFDTSHVKTVWLPSVGVRPGLTLRLPVSFLRVDASLTPFARWDLVRKTVTVDVAGQAGQYRSYDVGGTTVGVVLGIGLEI